MRASNFSLQGITCIFPIAHFGINSLHEEGVQNPMGSTCQKLLRAQECEPGANMKTGHSRCLPCHVYKHGLGLPGLVRHRTWRTHFMLHKWQKEHNRKKLVSTKMKHYLHCQPGWLDAWSYNEINNQQILRLSKGPLNLQNRIPGENPED